MSCGKVDGYQPEGTPVSVVDVELLVPVKYGIVSVTTLPIRVAYAVPVGVVVHPVLPVSVKLVSP